MDVADRVGIKAATTRDAADEWLARYPDDASVMPHLTPPVAARSAPVPATMRA